MKRHSSIFLALGFLAWTGCSQSPAPDTREATAHALREGEVAAFVKDWAGRDADRIAAHYTDDGTVMFPNAPLMTGKDAIGKAIVSSPHLDAQPVPRHTEINESLAKHILKKLGK